MQFTDYSELSMVEQTRVKNRMNNMLSSCMTEEYLTDKFRSLVWYPAVGCKLLLLLENGRIIGFISGIFVTESTYDEIFSTCLTTPQTWLAPAHIVNGSDYIYIHTIVVDRAYQHLGLGQKLFNEFMLRCRLWSNHLHYITTAYTRAGAKFFKHKGFSEVRTLEDGIKIVHRAPPLVG